MLELWLAKELPLTVVATAAVGDGPEVDTRFILDLHTETEDLRIHFRDTDALRLLRRATLAMLRHAQHVRPVEAVISVAFSRPRPAKISQAEIDFLLADDLPY